MKANTKPCEYCKRQFGKKRKHHISHFMMQRFCSVRCATLARTGVSSGTKRPSIYKPQIPVNIVRIEKYQDYFQDRYNTELSEVTGLSRRYLDGEINLHELRELEISLHA